MGRTVGVVMNEQPNPENTGGDQADIEKHSTVRSIATTLSVLFFLIFFGITLGKDVVFQEIVHTAQYEINNLKPFLVLSAVILALCIILGWAVTLVREGENERERQELRHEWDREES